MFIVNGIAYAETRQDDRKIVKVDILPDMIMILTFSSGEKRLYDASNLLEMPAFKKLSNPDIFENPLIEHGVVTWDNGNIDIAPETMYKNSYQYN